MGISSPPSYPSPLMGEGTFALNLALSTGRGDRMIQEYWMELSKAQAIRCEHDGLKMAEVKAGCLILRQRHHGETHIQIVPLSELLGDCRCEKRAFQGGDG